jgi:hypothetical protein
VSAELGFERGPIADGDILHRLLGAMVREGSRLLEEGVSISPVTKRFVSEAQLADDVRIIGVESNRFGVFVDRFAIAVAGEVRIAASRVRCGVTRAALDCNRAEQEKDEPVCASTYGHCVVQ